MTKPLFIALDFDQEADMWALLKQLDPSQEIHVKVGMEMFYQYGSEIVRELSVKGFKVFLT